MKIHENGKTEAFKLKNLLFLLMGLFLSVNLFAQTSQVGGKVVDETGSALIGVTVVVKGTTNGTVTNIDGNYTLAKVPESATLVFSFRYDFSRNFPYWKINNRCYNESYNARH